MRIWNQIPNLSSMNVKTQSMHRLKMPNTWHLITIFEAQRTPGNTIVEKRMYSNAREDIYTDHLWNRISLAHVKRRVERPDKQIVAALFAYLKFLTFVLHFVLFSVHLTILRIDSYFCSYISLIYSLVLSSFFYSFFSRNNGPFLFRIGVSINDCFVSYKVQRNQFMPLQRDYLQF